MDYADKISWAIYNVDNGFTFKFKNKLTDKFIQATSVADDNAQNVEYVAEDEATAFELDHDKNGSSRSGDYALKASINGVDGYLSSTSATGYSYATHYKSSGHNGAWLKFVEAPDFDARFAEVNAAVESVSPIYGTHLGQYHLDGVTLEDIVTAMEDSGTVKLNTLIDYKEKLDAPLLNMPVAGQFFRIRGISGNYIDASSIYNNANATTGQMSMKSADACNYNGTIFYLDEDKHLLNYATGTYVKQTSEIGSVGDTKGVWTIAESPRTGNGKYELSCTTTDGAGAHLHDNSGNRADRCSGNCGDRHDFTLEEVTTLPITIHKIGYGTLYAPVPLAIPEGVKAYTGTLDEATDVLTLIKVTTGVIPATTGVMLYREATAEEATDHDFEVTTCDDDATKSVLTGSVATVTQDGTQYTLQTHDFDGDGTNESVAFKLFSGTSINGFKAYLPITNDSGSEANARSIRVRYAGDETTEIKTTDNSGQATVIYDLMGRRVEKMEKGVYIVNGKKVIK